MGKILKGLRERLDVSAYANPKFSPEQMFEIYLGSIAGVNVNAYADPKFSPEQMKEIRKGLMIQPKQELDISGKSINAFS